MNGESTEASLGLLTCWKDIASYLGKGVRTVQRWEQEFGLPVLRPSGDHHKSAVIVRTRDLDLWMESKWSKRKSDKKNNGSTELRDLIQTAKALRQAHLTLMHQNSVALASLIGNCNELIAIRQINEDRPGPDSPPPRRLW